MARTLPDLAVDDHATQQFRAFYDEIIKARDRTADSRELEPNVVAHTLAKHLENLLELQTLESRRESTRFELENVADARYLKAALADEILLNTPWVGREHWTAHLHWRWAFKANTGVRVKWRGCAVSVKNCSSSFTNAKLIFQGETA